MKKVYTIILLSAICGLSANAQWQTTNGPFTGYKIYSLAANGTDIFCGSSYAGGIFLYNGTSWNAVNNGLTLPTNTDINTLAISGTNIFAGTGGQGAFLSTNNGNSWTAINNGLPSSAIVLSFAINGTNIYAGTGGAYIDAGVSLSTNNGGSWARIDSIGNGGASAIAINGGNIFASGMGGIQLSTNNGNTWSNVNNGLGYGTYYCFAIIGTNIFAGGDQGVYMTTNNGNNWTAVSSSMIGAPTVYSLVTSGTNIFAGTDQGVFLSTNNGGLWTAVNTGLPINSVRPLVIRGAYLFTGVSGGGVWKRPLSEMITGINEIQNNIDLHIYPNPSNGIFSLVSENMISNIEITNVLGEKIYSEKTNSNKTEVDLSNQPKGIYFYKITTQEKTIATGKLIIQ